MANSVDLAWASCHVRVSKGGWSELHGVPAACIARTAHRLLVIGASSASVISPYSIRFRAGASVCQQLIEVFPCCPVGQ